MNTGYLVAKMGIDNLVKIAMLAIAAQVCRVRVDYIANSERAEAEHLPVNIVKWMFPERERV